MHGAAQRLRILQRCLILVAVALASGCALHPVLDPANDRAFEFERDTFAFDNEVEWKYNIDPVKGTTEPAGENPDAEYTRHCFVLSRSARQFFQFARFEPGQPRLNRHGYRSRIREVIAHDPMETGDASRVVIPGYASLREFSADWGGLLKDELGSAAESYLQRGNWRMVFPFTPEHQSRTAEVLAQEIAVNRPPIVHLSLFPELTINHAVLLYAVEPSAEQLRFHVYDPNDSRRSTVLVFDRAERSFRFSQTGYFAGGEVDVYQVYRSALY